MLKELIKRVVEGEDLTESEVEQAFIEIMEGEATPAQIASFITALRMKGETVNEICGAAKAMRKKATAIDLMDMEGPVLDTCGTGGDTYNTFNISTACAFVASAAGIRVAKHGNRSVSSKCGSADVLEELGVRIALSPEQVKRCIRDIGIGFIFAPLFHGAMKHALAPRREIGIRTIFNLLGPLTNPAGADVQLLGVYSPELTEKIANVLMRLGVKRAIVVSGLDGMDEISACAETRISYLKDGRIETYEISPEEFGLRRASPAELKGGDARENARIIMGLFSGERGAKRDALLINAGAAIFVATKARDLKEGIDMAAHIIDSGRAMNKLEELIRFTRSI